MQSTHEVFNGSIFGSFPPISRLFKIIPFGKNQKQSTFAHGNHNLLNIEKLMRHLFGHSVSGSVQSHIIPPPECVYIYMVFYARKTLLLTRVKRHYLRESISYSQMM